MDKQPFFSVIIPTFNAGSTIKNCLDSISKQNFDNFEVLVIDSESADDTAEIVNQHGFKAYPLKWLSEKDKGIYDAMNKGIALAKGSYLYFMGSDDTLFNENVLSVIVNEIDKTNALIIYGNVITHGTNKWVADKLIHAGEFDLKRILNNNICHQSIFYHKSVFKTVGNYNIKYRVFADYDFNLRCFALYNFSYTDTIIANFNIGGASTQLTDAEFENDKDKNIIKYFFGKLHTKPFIDLRLYVQQVALSKKTKVNIFVRLYCLMVYAKLKIQSLLI